MPSIIITINTAPTGVSDDPEAIYYSVSSYWIWQGGIKVQARTVARRCFLVLVGREGTSISSAELAELLWGDRKDGGPENVRASVGLVIQEAREIARQFGYVIGAGWGRGWTARYVRGTAVRLRAVKEG